MAVCPFGGQRAWGRIFIPPEVLLVDLGICQDRLLSGYFFSRCSLPFRWHRELGFLFLSFRQEFTSALLVA